MASPPLMSPPPADFQFIDKTPVKMNGAFSKSKGREIFNTDGK